ncbi:hypothetical protein Q8A67_001650 [Cirrhinus molitorella]|uniref:AIG1-type G domain-containing protein n=1 Tax=Cirrhinus molitorella TaxID=172907 RepID=A0AA88Q6S1_9TELE|nr:hypothetical protein Q8A67_001650 [Cirrhinus molitorella]
MVIYLLGGKFEEEEWYEITEEEAGDQSESQTSEITMYEVFPLKSPIALTIIDTPGYGDTRGLEKDLEVAANLATLFQSRDGVPEIDAVCFMIQASKNRLSDRQHYIISSVLSLFGKHIVDNIVFLITHSDGLPPKNVISAINKAKIPCRLDKGGQLVYFLFNNRQPEARHTERRHIRAQKVAFEDSMDGMKDFLESLQEKNRSCLELTSDVLIERIRLEVFICNLQLRLQEKELKKSEKLQIQKAMRENRENIDMGRWTPLLGQWVDPYKSMILDYDEFKKEYEKAQEQYKRFSVIMNDLDMDLQEIEDQKSILLSDAYSNIKHLSQIPLKPDSAFTLRHLNFFIPRVREAGKVHWVCELEEMRRNAEAEEANKDTPSYLRAGLGKLSLLWNE